MKQKALTVILLAIMSVALVLPFSNVLGQPPTGFSILQITKQGTFTPQITEGFVDEPINVIATQTTSNGPFLMYFGDVLVDNSTSQGYFISSNFTVPELPGGNYTITLVDLSLSQTTTAPFLLKTNYVAKPVVPNVPLQLQEGASLGLNVSVTGGQPNATYGAEITVMLPAPLSSNYSRTVSFTSSGNGTANALLNFPDSSFQPSGSTTIYAGFYAVFFNVTQNLGNDTFTIGLTDQNAYHRGDVVKIHAAGYAASQNAALTIQLQGGQNVFSQSVTADAQGAIDASWSVPNSVVLGDYNVTIAPQSGPKAVPDTQLFSILGLPITFQALNLAGEAVPGIEIEALDHASNIRYNGTTGIDGFVSIRIEEGNYTVDAFWNQVNVGESELSISGNSSYTIQCRLTDLKILVQDKTGAAIPFVNLNFKFQYTTRTGETQDGSASAQTDILGGYVLNSTLPGINYVVDASKYNVVFNSGNNTISNLPAQPLFQALILTPDEPLSLKTVDYNMAALSNVRLELIEQASGIFYSATTGGDGSVSVQVTFGQYRIRVYTSDNILLNETQVSVLNETQAQIRCALYNLNVKVKVVDYFGNPIPNANVVLSRNGVSTQLTTQSDGTTTFNNVIGGNVGITAYPSGTPNSYVATVLQLQEPTTVQVSLEKYAQVGPFLMETSLLATLIVILVAILLFLIIELYLWRGFRLRSKSEAESKMSNLES